MDGSLASPRAVEYERRNSAVTGQRSCIRAVASISLPGRFSAWRRSAQSRRLLREISRPSKRTALRLTSQDRSRAFESPAVL